MSYHILSFIKIQIDELTKYSGMTADDYTAVRCGMNVTKAIVEGEIDAGIGLENVQMVELEEWLATQGRPKSDVQMLRIDELAELGCCCFCSILYIVDEEFLSENPEKVAKFMKAVKKATDYVLTNPALAYKEYIDVKPFMATSVNRKIYERSYAYFSKDLKNVQRTGRRLRTMTSVSGFWTITSPLTTPINSWVRSLRGTLRILLQIKRER